MDRILITADGTVLSPALGDLFELGSDHARFDHAAGAWVPAHAHEEGAWSVTVRERPGTTLPVTDSGWYEHSDGTLGRYCWQQIAGAISFGPPLASERCLILLIVARDLEHADQIRLRDGDASPLPKGAR